MTTDSTPNQPNKRTLRDAQARHQSALFGDQPVQKPSSQQAETESRQRGQALSQAAAQKRQQLTPEEAQKLAELQARSQTAKPAAAKSPAPAAKPTAPPPRPSQLHEAAKRNDLAAAAVASMRRNLKTSDAPPARSEDDRPNPPRSSAGQGEQPQPTQAPAPVTQPRPTQTDRPSASSAPRPAGKRPAPSPEELDRLLREMAQRSAARRQPGPAGGRPAMPGRPGMPGAERGESMPTAEAPPEPPPEIAAEEEKSPEKQAEILRELKAREATARRDIAPIPQADQERAEERAVEATVPIRTEGNAVSAAPLHAAIADLQNAMRAHDAPGQVAGVNVVQRNMPNHPLYAPEQTQGQTQPDQTRSQPPAGQPPQESHGT